MAKKQEQIDIRHYDVIVAPHITEKSTLVSEHNAVVFKVAGEATKPQIKAAVEAIFGVGVAHDRPEGQDEALEGQALHAQRHQEGDRHAEGRRFDRRHAGGQLTWL